jgi:hypothetical protein
LFCERLITPLDPVMSVSWPSQMFPLSGHHDWIEECLTRATRKKNLLALLNG